MARQFTIQPSSDRERKLRQERALRTQLAPGQATEDQLKSITSGVRSGVEQSAGMGDIEGMQEDAVKWLLGKVGVGDETAGKIAGLNKYTSPFSLMPTSEQVGAATDRQFGRDDWTRHTPLTSSGELLNTTANLATGLVGGPEDVAKLGATKLAMAVAPALKEGRAALAEAKAAKKLKAVPEAAPAPPPGLPASVGDLNNPPVMFEGVSPRDFTDTAQWHRFGQSHGVENLGSPDTAAWQASLQKHTTSKGQEFTVPGTEGPFTYYDLLHLKQQGINPNDIPPELHQSIHDRMTQTHSQGEMTPERMMNQLILAQISPNQPLSPNELAVARTMVKGPEDLDRLGQMVPWHHADRTMPNEVVGTKQVPDKKTGQMVDKKITRRNQLSDEIANKLGLGKGKEGGLGARGTADYTRIAETAQRMKEDPEFFRFRGAEEGGATSAEQWANFVERLSNQTPGLSSKTGSFGGVWQDPHGANISAVDRHMASKFNAEMFPSPEEYQSFKTTALERFKKANPDSPIADYDALPQGFKNDQIFGYLNNNESMKYRQKAAKGSNSGVGPVNPRVPEHLQPDQAKWVGGHEPESIELMSPAYKRVLQANADEANKAGQSIFGSQWMLWDRIRNRLEPHEIMFPGLEKIPRMSMDQMRGARADMSGAGYMSGTKMEDVESGAKSLQPVRPLPSASRAAYFTHPLTALGGGAIGAAALEEALRQRDAENRNRGGNRAL